MSAFVVGVPTMHRCVAAICHRHEYGRVIPLFDGLDTGARGVGTKIGQRLFALNIVGIRPDRDDVLRPEIARLPKHYRYEPPAVELALPELIASIKALHCLHYQCDEQPNERNPLLAELADATRRLSDYAITQTAEYNAASWG